MIFQIFDYKLKNGFSVLLTFIIVENLCYSQDVQLREYLFYFQSSIENITSIYNTIKLFQYTKIINITSTIENKSKKF
jgi:hypothetical protein